MNRAEGGGLGITKAAGLDSIAASVGVDRKDPMP